AQNARDDREGRREGQGEVAHPLHVGRNLRLSERGGTNLDR
ncbi:MAG: hypothetical protein JWL67_897, partial [Solirubrobacterales bacterium]|nr:hypothetical protein [Solirubrobacterales bacterium]